MANMNSWMLLNTQSNAQDYIPLTTGTTTSIGTGNWPSASGIFYYPSTTVPNQFVGNYPPTIDPTVDPGYGQGNSLIDQLKESMRKELEEEIRGEMQAKAEEKKEDDILVTGRRFRDRGEVDQRPMSEGTTELPEMRL